MGEGFLNNLYCRKPSRISDENWRPTSDGWVSSPWAPLGGPTQYIYIYINQKVANFQKGWILVYKFNTGFLQKILLFFGSSWHFNNSYIHFRERKSVKEFA